MTMTPPAEPVRPGDGKAVEQMVRSSLDEALLAFAALQADDQPLAATHAALSSTLASLVTIDTTGIPRRQRVTAPGFVQGTGPLIMHVIERWHAELAEFAA